MNALLAKLEELRIKYSTASEDQRSDLQLQWKDLVAEGEQLEPKLIEAAEKAYSEAPNADKGLADFLAMLLQEMVQADDYEPAAKIAKLLMDNNCSEKHVPNLAGIAAFAVSDFDAAEKYFTWRQAKATTTRLPRTTNSLRSAYHSGDNSLLQESLGRGKSHPRPRGQGRQLASRGPEDQQGGDRTRIVRGSGPEHRGEFHQPGAAGFYKDTPFHRVLQGFMAQGGDPTGTAAGGPGYSIACECYGPNHRNHFRGSLSMAHAGRDTGGSQFFITFLPPTAPLDGMHTVFGRVIRGMDVLAKLQRRDPNDSEAPRPDKILEAKVIRKRLHDYKPQVMPE